jgi:murein L,D-transpeptidase YafK
VNARRSPLPTFFTRFLRLTGIALLASGAAGAAPGELDAETRFQRALQYVVAQRQVDALRETDQLLLAFPNFRLAHLLRGDLLAARIGEIGEFGNTGHASRGRLTELREEALARLRAYRDPPPKGLVPRDLLVLSPETQHAVVIDASRARVFVYENGNGVPRLVADYYTTLGKRGIDKLREGDQKTPIGVYHVVSSIPGSRLPDLYGWGALPIDYPNEWDRRAGKTGHGIWLHGVPSDTYARAPWASDGCVALANPEIAELAKRVQVGATPVIIAQRLDWVTPESLRAEREAFLRQFEAWREDWESREMDRYFTHYAREFAAGAQDFERWKARKRRIDASKSWVEVEVSGLSVLRSPGEHAAIQVTFDQTYRSNNLSQRTRKRQYWVQEDGRWRIAYEAPVRASAVRVPASYPAGAAQGRTRSAGRSP